MTTEEKFKTGNYILLRRYLISDGYYIENDPKAFDTFCPNILINKKHKHILDAYLLDNDVEIDKYINIHEHYNTSNEKFQWTKENEFISNYDENIKYRLLDIIEPFDDSKEYITVPNIDKKFLKPDFECNFIRTISSNRIVAEIKLEDEDYDYVIFDEAGKLISSIDNYCYSEDINLTPYIEPKPWYEIESNFPTMMVRNQCPSKPEYPNEHAVVWNHSYFKEKYEPYGWRYATNEEIDSLKIKD